MRSRPISVFTFYHSDNAKTEISSRLLEIMKKVNCRLWADTPALAFFYLFGSFIFTSRSRSFTLHL